MNIFLQLPGKRHLLMGGLWLCATVGAIAITLGPNTRSAVLGQPLDISVQMLLDAGDDAQALCLEADIFYADKKLDKSQVAVIAEKSVNRQESLIRIRAATPVEGPVVTVHLRAGCVQKTARRYVVLAAKPRSTALSAVNGLQAGATPVTAAPDIPPSPEKVQALETELRQMREELSKNQAALAAGKTQLEKAESSRYGKALLYGVGGLLAFALAGLLFLSSLRARAPAAQQGSPEWRPSGRASAGPDSRVSMAAPVTGASPEPDIDESLFGGLKPRPRRSPPESIPPLPRRDRARFSVSVPFVHRTVKVPELFDLQQQVEFFSSLGQQDKAIALLRRHLVDNVKTSALVYLDLLDLYHQTGNEEDYEVLRVDFNRVFSTQIAPFDSYSAAGSDEPAYAYAAALGRIQAVWPARQVLGVIDDALFREPGNAAEVLNLESYRELLLLYAVAREITELEADTSGTGSITNWSELSMQPRSSPRLGLDIDLSQFTDSSDNPDRHAGKRAAQGFSRATREDSRHAGPASTGSSLPAEPTVLDSLVDFDDYDTGFRPDDFASPVRS